MQDIYILRKWCWYKHENLFVIFPQPCFISKAPDLYNRWTWLSITGSIFSLLSKEKYTFFLGNWMGVQNNEWDFHSVNSYICDKQSSCTVHSSVRPSASPWQLENPVHCCGTPIPGVYIIQLTYWTKIKLSLQNLHMFVTEENLQSLRLQDLI